MPPARECGVEGGAIADTLSSYILKNGRMQTFRLGQHHGTLLTSKHENSIAYDTNLRYIASTNQDCTVLIIVDAVSRKYFTSETSWLWDIDFDQLNVPNVKRVIISGLYRNDLAERFTFTGVQNWEVIPGIPDAAAAIKAQGSEDLYVVTCFSDRDKLLNLPGCGEGGLSHGIEAAAFLSRSHEPLRQLCQCVYPEADTGGHGEYRCGGAGAPR